MKKYLQKTDIKILMIDDNEEDYIFTKQILSKIIHTRYSFEWANSFDKGLIKLSEKKHDICIIDYKLGSKNGLDVINETISRDNNIPFILLTGQHDIEIDLKALNSGASDYLIKGEISPDKLERSIRYSLWQSLQFQEIKLLNKDLEDKVTERTKYLSNTINELDKTKNELANSLEKQIELNEIKSQFVSFASHEFRTPLSAILSSLSLIKTYGEKQDIEKQKNHIVKAESCVHNLTDLLDDFLSLGKIEEGVFNTSLEKISIYKFISEICNDMLLTVKDGQKINYLHSGEETIHSDKKLLKNILYNLTSNAIKYSSNCSNIEINSERKKTSFTISVKDNGIGISDEDQASLFQRFFRAKNSEGIQGTGLGLNIVSKYVHLLNGEIKVSSQLNKGTEFTLTIPQ